MDSFNKIHSSWTAKRARFGFKSGTCAIKSKLSVFAVTLAKRFCKFRFLMRKAFALFGRQDFLAPCLKEVVGRRNLLLFIARYAH